MADEKYTFEQARIRLEEIATEVRKKDTSLEKSLDLLEEGVRLANICTELVDHPDVSASVPVPVAEGASGPDDVAPSAAAEESVSDGAAEGEESGVSGANGAAGASDSQDADDTATGDFAEAFDADGFDDVEEPSAAPAEEDTQD